MAESTASITFSKLRQEIGREFYGERTVSLLSSAVQSDIDAYIQSGVLKFYRAYDWSFLKPVDYIYLWADIAADTSNKIATASYVSPSTTITVPLDSFYPSMVGATIVIDTTSFTITGYVSSKSIIVTGDAHLLTAKTWTMDASEGVYRLPDDFAGLTGPMTFNAGTGYCEISIINEMKIRVLRQSDNSDSTYPSFGAVRPIAATMVNGQRWELIVWPVPSSVLRVAFRKLVNMNVLAATTAEYPYGGLHHGETILEYCLAEMEARTNGVLGTHTQRLPQLLAQSIRIDQKLNASEYYGIIYDPDIVESRRLPIEWSDTITYNGEIL